MDAALDAAFQVRTRKTLAINCLPMGVVVSSQCMTVATTSVREDMAVSLVKTFGGGYDQIVLIGDPLFMKRLTDHAAEQALDWTDYRVNAVVGEEIFGEHFRGYSDAASGSTRTPRLRARHLVVRRRRARPAPLLRDRGHARRGPRRRGRRRARPRPAWQRHRRRGRP